MANKKKTPSPQKNTVRFHQIKSQLHRQVHVDGAQGGLTPTGKVSVSFYGERMVLPKSEDFLVKEDGTLGKRIEDATVTIGGIVREIEFTTYMDISTARRLRDFLSRTIKEWDKVSKDLQKG